MQATQSKQRRHFQTEGSNVSKGGNEKRTPECEARPARQKRGTAPRTASCNPTIVAFGLSTQRTSETLLPLLTSV